MFLLYLLYNTLGCIWIYSWRSKILKLFSFESRKFTITSYQSKYLFSFVKFTWYIYVVYFNNRVVLHFSSFSSTKSILICVQVVVMLRRTIKLTPIVEYIINLCLNELGYPAVYIQWWWVTTPSKYFGWINNLKYFELTPRF